MSTFGKRLKQLRKDNGLSQQQLADRVRVDVSSISRWETDKMKIEAAALIEIAQIFGVTPEWLTKGGGEMFANTQNVVNDPLVVPNNGKRPTGNPIPFYDMDVTAGNVTFFDEGFNQPPAAWLYLPAFQGCVAARLSGDSMADRYNNGDILFFQEIEYWKDGYVDFGQVFLVVTRRGLRTVKYVRKGSTPESWSLEPHNLSGHQAFEVPLTSIVKMFKVKGKMQQDAL